MRYANCHLDKKHCARGLCYSCYRKKLREINPEFAERKRKYGREWNLQRNLKKFGLTEDGYKKLEQQGCEICGTIKQLVMDHNHGTEEFRGLLCRKHNINLGGFGDSIEMLERAIAYLKRKNL